MSNASSHRFKMPWPEALTALAETIDWLPAHEAQKYCIDPRDRFVGQAAPVFLPRSTAEVSQLVSLCHAHDIKIIAYGGGTGVVAGQLVLEEQNVIVLSLEKMNKIRSVSAEDGVLIAEAGCILKNVQTAAQEIGMNFPLSMASEGSCMIGGNLATNCGGIQVLRYGNARDLCLGIEAVLPDGSVLNELTPLRKNNTGYDLRHLIIGSEGTLAVITAASLCLKPVDQQTLTAFCAVQSPLAAMQLLSQTRKVLGDHVSAFELMCDFGFTVLERHFPQERFPLQERAAWYVLMELGGGDQLEAQFESLFEQFLQEDLVQDGVMAASKAQRDALWRLREYTPEANRLNGAICNSDTAVPLRQISHFIERTYNAIAEIDPSLTVNCYGHMGDGNIHFNVFAPFGRSKKDIVENDQDLITAIRNAITMTTLECGGSISAEHGIGRLKRDDLSRFADPVKLATLKAIKTAIDPKNIMNPHALLPIIN